MELSNEQLAQKYFKSIISSYFKLSDMSWRNILQISSLKKLSKDNALEYIGEKTNSFYFIVDGLVRSFTLTKDGKETTKIFFEKGGFPGNIVSKLNDKQNKFTIEALENITYFEINYLKYRELITNDPEIAQFHIAYIELNWIKEKEELDLSLRTEDASVRYQKFMKKHPNIYHRIPLGHIASYLGITQTQLSRIRKNL